MADSFRAITFQNGHFKEEQKRPHLDQSVYYGMGSYSFDGKWLVLNYEPFPDAKGYDYEIQHTKKDSAIDGYKFRLHFYDIQSKKPLNRLELSVLNDQKEVFRELNTDRNGMAEFSVSDPEYFQYLRTNYHFYKDIEERINARDANYHEIHIGLRAGVAERKEEGTDSLRVKSLSSNEIVLYSYILDDECELVPRKVYSNLKNNSVKNNNYLY